ncbi:MAG: hypothetical protein KJ767_01685 [Nanoarchaeota archaeon]|nr:hypothetical protein [Nanoarchaeota archaeon]
MEVEELKKQYKDEWVLVEVLKVDEVGQPVEVKLITHSKNRDDIYEELRKTKVKDVATFYTGKIPKKSYAVAFITFKW